MEFSLLCFAGIVNRFRGFFCMTVLIFISEEPTMKKMTFTAMAAVLICVCSWITIPFTIPFTMQTFAVFFAVLFLGGKNGIAAIALYLLMGMIGLPVFSGFRGGIGHLLGPTGGYIVGFLFTGIFYLMLEPFQKKSRFIRWVALAGGLVLCYLAGTLWFIIVTGSNGAAYTFWSALSLCVLPYIIPDCAKMILAVYLSDRVKKHVALND